MGARPKTAQALAFRARIVLACAEGVSNKVAAVLGTREQTAARWRGRFVRNRLRGLVDERRPGAPRTISDDNVENEDPKPFVRTKTFQIGSEESIADVLDAAGIGIVISCREGTCGSCETTVLAGDIAHRDSVLTAEEQADGKTMMLCVSRARSDVLVLDL